MGRRLRPSIGLLRPESRLTSVPQTAPVSPRVLASRPIPVSLPTLELRTEPVSRKVSPPGRSTARTLVLTPLATSDGRGSFFPPSSEVA